MKGDKSVVAVDSPAVKSFLSEDESVKKMQELLENIGYEYDSRLDYVGTLVEESERLGLSSMDEFASIAKGFRSGYFEQIIEGDWAVDASFTLLLAMIDQFADEFSEDHLLKLEWHEKIAARVMKHAGG